MENSNKEKKHADFQDRYHRSSNFRKTVKKEYFTIKGDGDLAIPDTTE